jgi:UDP-N-acetylmuramyl pentapeptide phosphotransferase/UDP-N-acetylglucosamine-1-phosphate transferase
LFTLCGLLAFTAFVSSEYWTEVFFYTLGVGLVACVSWLDDLYALPTRVRLAAHSLAAILAIITLGQWDEIVFPLLGPVHLGWLGLPVTFLWIVGLTNAYNFMDGIDGIAGGQAVVAGFGWAIIGSIMDLPFLCILGTLLAATSLGFLFHNWPPARIFMGDVGSAFLGYSFACLAIIGARKDPRLAIAGVFLVWPFVFDTIFTFFRRLKNRENVFSAHRSHLYQRLVISGYSHRTITLLYLGLDVLGLLFALLVVKKNVWTDLIVAVILAICCFVLWRFTFIREKRQAQEISQATP